MKERNQFNVCLYTYTPVCAYLRGGWMHSSFRGIFHFLHSLSALVIHLNPYFPLSFCVLVSLLPSPDPVISPPLYLHLSDLISFIFFLTHISISPPLSCYHLSQIIAFFLAILHLLPPPFIALSPSSCQHALCVSMLCVCVSGWILARGLPGIVLPHRSQQYVRSISEGTR